MMKSFYHISAKTVEEAVTLLQDYKDRAKLIAGGTDLLGALKDKILPDYPEVIINIKTIPGLDFIKVDKKGLRIGALTKLADIAESPAVNERYKLLAEAAESVATPQIRNMGTIGGNLCQDVRCWYYRYPHQVGGRILCLRKGGDKCFVFRGDNRYHAIFGRDVCRAVCASDTAIALTSLDAKVKIAGLSGIRTIPIRDFFGSVRNILEADEMVTEIQVPRPLENSRQTFLKFRLRKAVDFPIVSVASVITISHGICEDARIVIGAVAPRPIRSTQAEQTIKGRAIDAAMAEAASEAAISPALPLNRNRYKVEIAKTLIKRAILS